MSKHYNEVEGVKVFHDDAGESHDDYDAAFLDTLYKFEQEHFWFQARREFICGRMSHFINKSCKLIEIGAGTGNVARYLMQGGYTNVSVGELHFSGLKYAKNYGIDNCYQFDLLRTPFENDFDVVCLFDVLEHLDCPGKALSNVHKMLSSNGYVVLTLPAHNWLWCRDDRLAGHKRRYTKSLIERELEENEFEIVTNQYFFSVLIPFLLMRRFVFPDKGTNDIADKRNLFHINSIINKVLYNLCKLEQRLHSHIPNWFGGSLFVIGKKK